VCTTWGDDIDEGTMCLARSPAPGPVCIEGRPDPPSSSLASNPAFRAILGRNGTVIGYYRSSGGYSEVRNTDGEIVWSDELPLQHGIPLIDTALDAIEDGLKHLGYAVVGTLDTVLEDNWAALGLPLDEAHRQPIAQKLGIPLDATAYSIGRGACHLISLLQTAAELVGGATLFVSGAGELVAGVATTPAGVGVVIVGVGVVTVAAGTTVVIHGGVLGRATFMNMMKGDGGGGRPPQPGIRPPKSVPRVSEKTTRFGGGSPRENFNRARADAIAQAKLKPDKVPFRAELGPPQEIGRIKGSMNSDGVSGGWRLDFDSANPSKGLHINWWRMEGGTYIEGANVIEGGTQDLYWEILSHFPPMD
jgi:hypothetical protein